MILLGCSLIAIDLLMTMLAYGIIFWHPTIYFAVVVNCWIHVLAFIMLQELSLLVISIVIWHSPW